MHPVNGTGDVSAHDRLARRTGDAAGHASNPA